MVFLSAEETGQGSLFGAMRTPKNWLQTLEENGTSESPSPLGHRRGKRYALHAIPICPRVGIFPQGGNECVDSLLLTT